MRLLFVLTDAAFGGVERQAELLAEQAHAEGHEVHLIVIGVVGPALPRFRRHCHSIDVLDANIRNDLTLWYRLRAAARLRYDGAFIFTTVKLALLSHALRQCAPRQVFHVGNPVGSTPRERWTQQIRAWLFPPSPRMRLMANSLHTLRSLQVHPFYGRWPLSVSLNCVRLPPQPVPLREICRPIRVGMVARLDPIKDHATLIRAVALLHQGGQPVECELVGDGMWADQLKALASQLGLDGTSAVRFCGQTDDVETALGRWDLFIFSTTRREGFGNAAAEAMGHGLPCVLSDVGPCREVGGQDAVAYVPPADPARLADMIVTLARDFPARQELGRAAYDRAQATFGPRGKLEEYLAAVGIS